MSYQQYPAYSAPSSFSQPPISTGYYGSYTSPLPVLPPAPVYHDSHAFRRDFSARLGELVVNSRPIIQALSITAHEYTRFADIVAHCLEAHIRRVPPWIKLPAFYLLDMISKNIYEPYARHFATFVIPLFLESYQQMDDSTRGKMEELLLTWRTGSPDRKELFGVAAQLSIERGIWGDGAASGAKVASGSSQVTKSQVISELEFTLGQKERALQNNPYDTTAQNHVAILQQLRKIVEAGVSQEELKQILNQLHTLVRNSAPPPPSQSAPSPQATSSQWPATVPQPPFVPPVPALSITGPVPQAYPQGSYPTLSAPVPTPSSSSTPVSSAGTTHTGNIGDLLSTLLKAGIVSGTPVSTGAAAAEEKNPELPDPTREAARSYRRSILSQDIKLTTSDISKKRPQAPDLLYRRLSAQCKQCGMRFLDSSFGKKMMEEHLDMHFRQNRKANQNLGRGHSRSWFVGLEDWVHDVSDIKGKGKAGGSRPLNPKAAAAEEAAKRDAELRSQFVVVPQGDEAKSITCPICKEIFNAEWQDDDEDWVWKNAVMKDDRVFHATCHAETAANSLARLRIDSNSNQKQSRGNTPESTRPASVRQCTPLSEAVSNTCLSPAPDSKLAGTKRKAADDSLSLTDPLDGTPPAKKIVLAA